MSRDIKKSYMGAELIGENNDYTFLITQLTPSEENRSLSGMQLKNERKSSKTGKRLKRKKCSPQKVIRKQKTGLIPLLLKFAVCIGVLMYAVILILSSGSSFISG